MINISHYFLCFVLYSFLGWVYESLFYSIEHRRPVNTGFLKGCICPIYGAGALLALVLLNEIENTVVLFCTAMVVCCTLEYFVSWLLEEMFDMRWWDYSDWPLNINGRVCLYGALAFGVLIVMLIKYIHPFVERIILGLDMKTVYILCTFFLTAIIIDMLYTLKHSDDFSQKLWFVHDKPKLFGNADLGGNRNFVLSKISQIRNFKSELNVMRFLPQRPKKNDIIQKIKDYINKR